ncbi:MAG: signal peptidase I [Verrucomicrobia bacterium]|nr:signal peptidase I [Verrucomicrobiota bacterium]MBI3871032.1 signal peptidase I [Verrucomicrobiota bacterium]
MTLLSAPFVTACRRLARWIERGLACVGLLFLLFHLSLEVLVMTSDSMSPALKGSSFETGDHVLVDKLSRRLRSPQRWEIYSYYNEDSILVAKRIVGLPGERISIRGDSVFVNGSPLERPHRLPPVRYYPYGSLAEGREVKCVAGYFMLGDDSIDSLDSRYSGEVANDRLIGRAFCVLSPASRRGFVR